MYHTHPVLLSLLELYCLLWESHWGSPSGGGDVMVYVSDINQPSLPALLILFLCLFLSLWPFQLYQS